MYKCNNCQSDIEYGVKFCSQCATPIDWSGVSPPQPPQPPQQPQQTYSPQQYQQPYQAPQPIIINNQMNNVNQVSYERRRHSLLLDLILIFCTGGLWIIWMLLRR